MDNITRLLFARAQDFGFLIAEVAFCRPTRNPTPRTRTFTRLKAMPLRKSSNCHPRDLSKPEDLKKMLLFLNVGHGFGNNLLACLAMDVVVGVA